MASNDKKNASDAAPSGDAKIIWLEPDDPRIPSGMLAALEEQETMPALPLPAEPFDPAILDAIRKDPYLAPKLDLLRDQAQQDFIATIEEIIAGLPKETVAAAAVELNGSAMSGRKLMINSRRGELADKSRRDLVEAMAIEILLNLGNPDWDPLQPETSKETPSALLALLR